MFHRNAAPSDDAVLIRAHDLRCQFGRVTALDGLTVSIEAGITGLVGANGAGKSTFIKILLGLVEPTGGSAELFGYALPSDRAQIRGLVGYMPEHECLPPDMTAAAFVAFLARCSGLPPRAARERAADVLRHVGLYEARYRAMGGYSTGMAQRVKLAQALVHDPRLLILDEPTNGLDPAGRDEMLALIARTGEEFGISVLVSSHLLGELERTCHRIVLLEQGRLVRTAGVERLTEATGVVVMEIDGDVPAFVDALTRRGLSATVERDRVLVALPEAMTPEERQRVYDLFRDTACECAVGLLRLERRRGQLEDLFLGAA